MWRRWQCSWRLRNRRGLLEWRFRWMEGFLRIEVERRAFEQCLGGIFVVEVFWGPLCSGPQNYSFYILGSLPRRRGNTMKKEKSGKEKRVTEIVRRRVK